MAIHCLIPAHLDMKKQLPTSPSTSAFLFACLSLLYIPSAQAADTTRTVVGPGAVHVHIHDPSQPVHIEILEFDLSHPENTITTVLANDQLIASNEQVKSMSDRNTGEGHLVIGALNGDYYGSSYPFDKLRNGQIIDNKYVFGGFRNRSSFGMTDEGKPVIDILNFFGQINLANNETFEIQRMNRAPVDSGLVIYNHYLAPNTRSDASTTEWRLVPQEDIATNRPVPFEVTAVERHQGSMTIHKDTYVVTGTNAIADSLYEKLSVGDHVHLTLGVQPSIHNELAGESISELIGGGPRLLTNGERSTTQFVGFEGFGENHSGERHSRSAVGFSKDSTKIYFVAVDGRQHTSRGATMRELADIMKGIGAWNAVNLDGGGSTTLVVRDEPANDHDRSFGLGTYRSVANGILAVAKINYEEITSHLSISPKEAVLDSVDTKQQFTAHLVDNWDHVLPGMESVFTWEIIDLDGELDDFGLFTAKEYGEGYIVAHYGEYSDTASVSVKEPVNVEFECTGRPDAFALYQNYPNPFNPDTRITFELPEAAVVRITIYDILGRPIAELVDEHLPAGRHETPFDATGLSSGTYIYELASGNFVSRKTMTLIK